MKKNRKIVLLVSDGLKKRLDQKKHEGFTLNGFIRATLEKALAEEASHPPRRRRVA